MSILNKYSEAVRGNLTKIVRLKVVALVTIEVHARDVLERLYKSGLMDVSAFDWLSQLRFYWEKVQMGQLPALYPKPNPDALTKRLFSKYNNIPIQALVLLQCPNPVLNSVTSLLIRNGNRFPVGIHYGCHLTRTRKIAAMN